ncbi:MAG: GNAT family N-acetyltransferase [Oscillospiraceae bacterium]|nr:GNAT family N-acetyltransferase [Oscillospiraceae bacterium]
MEYTNKTVLLKNGKTCLLRRAEERDAEMLIDYLKITSGETRNFVREPEEIAITLEEEQEFIRKNREDPRALHLLAEVDGDFAGSCSFAPVRERSRTRHRCLIGISLYQKFCGMGVGTALLSEILHYAKIAGYEQAELDVVSANAPAVGLYKKLGFETTGTIPHAFKYRDGSYADFLFMVKKLV